MTVNSCVKKACTLLAAVSLMVITAVSASAAHYYVSSSKGNDEGKGTMSDPWKTLARASEVEFQPGDVLYLRSGDRFEEMFRPKGNGDPKVHVPSGVWEDEGFITLTTYGCDKKAVIAPGKDKVYGILLENSAGWKIENIEVCDAMAGLRMVISEKDASGNGLWVNNCYFHDIEDAPQIPTHKEYQLYMTYAISTCRITTGAIVPEITNIKISNTLIERTDAPMTIDSVNGLIIENVVAKDNYKEGILLGGINARADYSTGSYIKNCRILNTGTPKGQRWGIAGLQFNSTRNLEVSQCEIAYTKAPGKPDGCGIDYEASNVNVTVRDCYIHDNEGPAFLVYKNGSWGLDNQGTHIKNNYLINNGLKEIEAAGSMFSHKHNMTSEGDWTGNVISLMEGQPIIETDQVPKLRVPEYNKETGEYDVEWFENYNVADNKIIVVDPKTTIMDGKQDEAYMKLIMGEDYVYESYAEEYFGERNFNKPYYNYVRSTDYFEEDELEIVKKFDFNDRTGTDGWTAGPAVTNLATVYDDGVTALRGDVIKKDAFIYSPDNLNIELEPGTVLVYRMKHNTTCTSGRWYYTKPEETKWDETRANGFSIETRRPDEYVTYYNDMSWIYTAQDGIIKQIRFDPFDNDTGSGHFYIDYIAIARKKGWEAPPTGPDEPIITAKEKPEYVVNYLDPDTEIDIIKGFDFNTDGDAEGWVGTGAVSALSVANGEMYARILKSDPYIYTPEPLGIKIDPERPLVLKFRFRQDTGLGHIRFYFNTLEDKSYSEAKAFSVKEYDINDTGYIDFCVDLSEITSMTGTLNRIRLDPVDNNPSINGGFGLDYFYIGRVSDGTEYIDVSWAEESMLLMENEGISNKSSEPGFNPTYPVTRGEMAEYVAKTLKLKEAGYDGSFSDVAASDDNAVYIQSVKNAGIMSGHADGSFDPNGYLTREQSAVIFSNVLTVIGSEYESKDITKFKDYDSFSGYSIPYVGKVVASGIMSGMGNNIFAPKSTLNYAEISVLISKLLENEKLKIEIVTEAEAVPEEDFEYRFEFEDGDMEGWYAGTAVSGLASDAGELFGMISAKDPFIYSPDNLGIDLSKNKVIKIRFRNSTKRGNAGFFFITNDDTTWGENKFIAVNSETQNTDYVEYYYDLSKVATAKGTLRQIRFDPISNLNGVTGEFGLDYVYIGTGEKK